MSAFLPALSKLWISPNLWLRIHSFLLLKLAFTHPTKFLKKLFLLAKLDIFEDEIRRRQEAADHYTLALSDLPGIIVPKIPVHCTSVWAQYSLLAEDADHRDALQDKLKKASIPTAIYYPKPLHLQTAFSHLPYNEGDFPISEGSADRIFSIPMHPYLTADQQEQVINALKP